MIALLLVYLFIGLNVLAAYLLHCRRARRIVGVLAWLKS